MNKMMMALVVACGCTVAGAGSGPNGIGGGGSSGGGVTAAPDWVSGSRLRARVQTTADGGRAFMNWYDSMLKTLCSFVMAADGQQRCLPYDPYSTAGEFYSDAGCTASVAQKQTDAAAACPPRYATKADPAGTSCSDWGYPQSATHVFSVGAPFTGTVYARSSGTPSTCTAYTMMTGYPYETYRFYQLGAEVAPSMFETGSVVTE